MALAAPSTLASPPAAATGRAPAPAASKASASRCPGPCAGRYRARPAAGSGHRRRRCCAAARPAVKQMPYESGMVPIGSARQRFDVKFYLIAILFLVFDVELLFLYPWAATYYETGIVPREFRNIVFIEVLLFLATVVVAYVY